MSLVFGTGQASPPSLIVPPATSADAPIAGDGFLPDVDIVKLRDQQRILAAVTPGRLREAVLAAILTVAIDLDDWCEAQRVAGHGTLAAVPSPALDGETRLTILYRRAIGCFAKAELVDRNPDLDATGPGRARAETDPSADELRRDGRHAIRDMLKRTRTDVALI